DLDWLLGVSHNATSGFSSLPTDKDYLAKRLELSAKSFAEQIPSQERTYIFACEEIASNNTVGIFGIQACVGHDSVFYNYIVSNITQMHRSLNIKLDHKVLELVDNYQHATDLISFWVDNHMRGKKIGKMLTMSVLLYIAQ